MTYQEIKSELESMEIRKRLLHIELLMIQSSCQHPELPKREPWEVYEDNCPDCGYVAFCYNVFA